MGWYSTLQGQTAEKDLLKEGAGDTAPVHSTCLASATPGVWSLLLHKTGHGLHMPMIPALGEAEEPEIQGHPRI